jgi:hypothetical protein
MARQKYKIEGVQAVALPNRVGYYITLEEEDVFYGGERFTSVPGVVTTASGTVVADLDEGGAHNSLFPIPSSDGGHESISVGAAVETLTVPGAACAALFTLEGDDIRYTFDGTDPSATVGHILNADLFLEYAYDSLYYFKTYSTGTSTLKVSYFKRG